MLDLRRRQFIALLASAAATCPVAALAQQTERRRVGVLMSVAADGPDGQPRLAAFLKRLQELGWTDGHNVRIDVRWGAGEAERTRKYVAELVALGPDVILASGDHPVVALQQATSTVPIIFAMVAVDTHGLKTSAVIGSNRPAVMN
jgi:putative ABC transport system substrate-binding protein